jgi:hypothetical protein
MGTKNEPGMFDCYANAEPDEPMFTLLARDPQASYLIAQWAHHLSILIDKGEKPESDRAQVKEAFRCAEAMDKWRKEHR